MATGNNRTHFVDKRRLPRERIKDTFFDYLATEILETAQRIWGSRRGVFGEAVLQGDGANKFKIFDVPFEMLDGDGHVLILESADAQAVQFENALGVTYYAAARHCLVPSGIQRNPRTGVAHYDLLRDSVGVTGVPNLVTQVGSTLTVRVDSVFETGVSHAGRKVTVWMNTPFSLDEGVAIERDLTVAWEGGYNVVHTSGILGQGSVSTVVGDYAVAATGVTVRRNTDLRAVSPYAFLGKITGVGAGGTPSAFDTSDQIDVSSGMNPTLDTAYDGEVGSGAGRVITVDSGAVELNTPSAVGEDSGDSMRAQLRLNRMGSSDYFQAMLQLLCGDTSHLPISALQAVVHGSKMTRSTAVSLSGSNLVTFTAVGIDVTDVNVRCNKKLHVLLLEDCPQAGLYLLDTFTVNSINVRALDGSAPSSWPAGTGTASLMVPRFLVAGSGAAPTGYLDWWKGHTFVLRQGQYSAASSLRILPEGAGELIVYDNSKTGAVVYAEPRELLVINPAEVGQDLKWPFRLKRSTLISGGDVSGGDEEDFYNRDGLRIFNAGGSYEARDTAFALVIDDGFPENVPTQHTVPTFAVETTGAVNRGHHLRDDFLLYPHGSVGAGIGPYATYYNPNPGACYVRDVSDGAGYGHGCVELQSGTAIGDQADFYLDLYPFNLDTLYDFRWTYRSRVKVNSINDIKVAHGFYQATVLRKFYFILNYISNEWYWRGAWQNPDGTYHVTDPICGLSADQYQWFEIAVASNTVIWTVEKKSHVSNSYGNEGAVITSLNGQAGAMSLKASVITEAATAKSMTLDYWEVWDREVVVGRHGTSHNLNHGA
jgi:hypothetical protein